MVLTVLLLRFKERSQFQQIHQVKTCDASILHVLNHTEQVLEHLSEVSIALCCPMKFLEV